MKFGKYIRRVRDGAKPEWRRFWMDYKMLKRLIKVPADVESRGGSSSPVVPSPQVLCA